METFKIQQRALTLKLEKESEHKGMMKPSESPSKSHADSNDENLPSLRKPKKGKKNKKKTPDDENESQMESVRRSVKQNSIDLSEEEKREGGGENSPFNSEDLEK